MTTSIIIAGFGGQGVLFAGQLLAYAAMEKGLHVTWIPSYGPEMRGGTANCTVIIDEEPIGAPTVATPDVAIVLNQPSYDKYGPLVTPGGLLIVNSSLVIADAPRAEIETVLVPANEIAEACGSAKMLNMAALGALLAARPILTVDDVSASLTQHLPSTKSRMLESNYQVLQRGYEHVAAVPWQ
jgi:2-oxoglutarate ferredoxin oxidoreductase subunit gamma